MDWLEVKITTKTEHLDEVCEALAAVDICEYVISDKASPLCAETILISDLVSMIFPPLIKQKTPRSVPKNGFRQRTGGGGTALS